ncbi:MAG: zinc dependent phospholipase C family protein [Eubacteriales bacterium]|nr:zinc dependent phospholipase C family protein [Eubacteriales bacterium]
MPTTYTHDLFGKKVYRKLPEEMQKVIRRHKDLYRIGLQGPDILFYYMLSKNPVTAFGVGMHRERACVFFQQGMAQVREKGDPALLTYLLGFGCHYLLDSACHPYVDQVDASGAMTHTLLEKEFDRYLMHMTNKNPYSYYPSQGIRPRWKYARVIHRAMPLVRTGNIYVSLKMQKFLTNLMVCDDKGRRRDFLGRLAGLTGEKNRKDLTDFFMAREPARGSRMYVEGLWDFFAGAVENAPEELAELFALSKEEKPLSRRWSMDYSGGKGSLASY